MSNRDRVASIIKELAKNARNRMKNGYGGIGINNEIKRRGINAGLLARNEVFASMRREKDDEMYLKVKGILTENPAISNPIGLMIDTEKYDCLDELARQKYIIGLSKKYNELKVRYIQETQG